MGQKKSSDSVIHAASKRVSDSAKVVIKATVQVADTLIKGAGQLPQKAYENISRQGQLIIKKFTGTKKKYRLPSTDSLQWDLQHPFKDLFNTRPLARFGGGYISYQFNYRSNIDTPYVEKDIVQHNVTANLLFTVADLVPVRATVWSRQSNSGIFRDITDVQVSFSGAEFRQKLRGALQDRMLKLASSVKDSITENLYSLKRLELESIQLDLVNNFSAQSLNDANRILRVPETSWDPHLPDSMNRQRSDSLQKLAAALLDLYEKTMLRHQQVKRQVDSLKGKYEEGLAKVAAFRNMLSAPGAAADLPGKWKTAAREYGLQDLEIPARYRWLMGIRNASVGRSTLDYSDLTVKNISVNGINFEYNSWYYFAVTAGLVDYRFRDFAMHGADKKRQLLTMVRAGLGRLEKNYFIVSFYHGQKQLFAATGAGAFPVTGISAEAKWQLNRTSWLTAELAQSIAPDYRSDSPRHKTRLALNDRTSQAVAFRLSSYWPSTQTRVEAFYKNTGANFQSFSSFQTNAALETWTIKAEQSLLGRKLRVTGALRKNEFTNPYLLQDYKSNTVFKSLTATFRMRKWPVVTVGFQPMSQLTAMDDKVMENRFQTLTATLYHHYRIRELSTATTVMLNKFYNNSSDTGFVYYNATNLYWMQHFFFKPFTASIAVSHTRNGTYTLNVMDEGFQVTIGERGTAGGGVKINSMNNEEVKTGGYLNANIRVWKQDMLYLSYERGYLPGFHGGLVRNEMATVQFVKSF
ncbi:MAG: hypothetical protein P0Y53_10615 [Candidatus Pseudobacter hemicellulosilyticus]|uniref:Uncharacterized protein n=1 Tax=Candidatus Pseudobacter hemicellulosilyticus TaxID=3121375 RepID=A0AAJ5WYJ9_9BACT|nr:MAG: hypothetical protein P0Y53_10615 [Pseudobacter sp.]